MTGDKTCDVHEGLLIYRFIDFVNVGNRAGAESAGKRNYFKVENHFQVQGYGTGAR